MKVYLNAITGIDDAIVTMFMTRRTWTRELEADIRNICCDVLTRNGHLLPKEKYHFMDDKFGKFDDWMEKLLKFGRHHITMLRFIDFSITVQGLHRAGQDDWDAHAMRYNNRIIRSSTRAKGAKDFTGSEVSDYYDGKILTMDKAIEIGAIDEPPAEFTDSETGVTWVRSTNGYVNKEFIENKDVKRGLYMLSIPSDFIFKVNLTEWAHVYKLRCKGHGANPEVQELTETIADLLEQAIPQFNRDLFKAIEN